MTMASAVAFPLLLLVTQNRQKSKIMHRLSQSHSPSQSADRTEYTVSEMRGPSILVFDQTSQFLDLLEKHEDSRRLWIKIRRHSWVIVPFILTLSVLVGALFVANSDDGSPDILISLMVSCFLFGYFGYALLTLFYAKLAPGGPPLVLLILRVFNNNCSRSLFSGYLRKWKLIGSRVFIIDNSYLGAVAKEPITFGRIFNAVNPLSGMLTDKSVLLQSGLLPSLIAVSWIAVVAVSGGILLNNPEHETVNQSLLIGIMWVLGSILLIVRNKILERSLIKAYTCNAESIRAVAGNKKKFEASLFGVYNDLSFYCNDGVWREVFTQLLQLPDAILMDLRGFQEKNIGCMHEIARIMNSAKKSRVLYLIDDDTNLLLLRNVFGSVTQSVNGDDRPIYAYKVTWSQWSETSRDFENILQMLCLVALGLSLVPESVAKTHRECDLSPT